MPITSTSSTGIAAQLQKHYDPKLLHHAKHELRLNEFGKKPTPLPKKAGSKQVAWQRRVAASASNVQTLSEGVAISTFTELTYDEVTATLIQYGEAARFTDVSQWVALNQLLKDGIALMGEDCALKADEITRAAIIAGVSAAGQKRYGQSLADFTALSGASAASGKMVALDALNAATRLKVNRAPKIGGYYIGIISPQVSRDLMTDSEWLESAKYGDVEKLYKGELGRLHGIRFVESTNPWIEDEVEGTYDATDDNADGLIYSTIITGAEAYGVANLVGQGPDRPQIVIVDTPDSGNPLLQYITAGWKAYYVAKVLNEQFCVVLRSKSLFTS